MFDPYVQWFKIPAGQRPPTYYELLDLTPDQARDPVAVREAAERRSDQLLRHTSGPNAEECPRIAAELEKALSTLLDSGLRRQYDARLVAGANAPAGETIILPEPLDSDPETSPVSPSQMLGKPAAKNERVTATKPAATKAASTKARAVTKTTRTVRPAAKPPGRPQTPAADLQRAAVTPKPAGRSAWLWVTLGGLAVFLVIAGGALAYLFTRTDDADIPDAPAPTVRAEAPAPAPPATAVPVPLAPQSVESQKPSAETAVPDRSALASNGPGRAAKEVEDRVGESLPAEPIVVKLPVPDEREQEKAEKWLKGAYRVDYENLKTTGERTVLAAKFLQPGREDRKNPARWFVLLREARDLAAAAGRPRLVVEAVNEIDKWFEIDAAEMALASLRQIHDPAGDKKAAPANATLAKSLAAVAMGRVDPALRADNFDAALKFIDLAEESLTSAKADKKLLAPLVQKRAEVRQCRDAYAAVAAAKERLRQAPDDPAANLVLGMHLACERGKWDEALPLIFKGGDPALKEAARTDFRRPADPKEELVLADFWWNYARRTGGHGEAGLQRHAAYWYGLAAERLRDGPERDRAADRVRQVQEIDLARGTRLPPGSVLGREPENRVLLLREGGGNAQSEDAVERALEWIVAHQSPDGAWRTDAFMHAAGCDCSDPGRKHDIAGTALGLMPLLAAGHTPRSGKYRQAVLRGLLYLRQKQSPDGNFAGPQGDPAAYENAMAAVALCEAYGMTKDPIVLEPALRAVTYVVNSQCPQGGWGYTNPGDPSGRTYFKMNMPDLSVTVWNIIALKTAVTAGVWVPRETSAAPSDFLDRVADPSGIAYWYKQPGVWAEDKAPRPSLLSTGILCREYCGWSAENKALTKAARHLADSFELGPKESPGLYHLFFVQQALHHYGGKEWAKVNARVRDQLVQLQEKGEEPGTAHMKGSWSFPQDQWAAHGGRLMFTALATLTLEVYYSHVPLNGYGQAVLND